MPGLATRLSFATPQPIRLLVFNVILAMNDVEYKETYVCVERYSALPTIDASTLTISCRFVIIVDPLEFVILNRNWLGGTLMRPR